MKRVYQKQTVRFPRELLEALRPLAEQENRSLNGEIVQACYEYLERKQKEAKEKKSAEND
jgi:hypothetical protein